MAKTRRSKKTRSRRKTGKSRKTLRGGAVDHVASYLKEGSDFYNSVEGYVNYLRNDEPSMEEWIDYRKSKGDTHLPIIFWYNSNFKNAVFDNDTDKWMLIRFGLIKDTLKEYPGVTDKYIVDYLSSRLTDPKKQNLRLTTYANYERIKNRYDEFWKELDRQSEQAAATEDDINNAPIIYGNNKGPEDYEDGW